MWFDKFYLIQIASVIVVFVEEGCQIDIGRIQNTGDEGDAEADNNNFSQGIVRKDTVEGAKVEEDGVDNLGNNSGAVIAHPEKTVGFFAGDGPEFVIEPDIKFLNNGKDSQSADEDSGSHAEKLLHVPEHKVIGSRLKEHPKLGKQDEGNAGPDTHVDCFVCF